MARLQYLPSTFRLIADGDHVLCAVTGVAIPLARAPLLERQPAGGLR